MKKRKQKRYGLAAQIADSKREMRRWPKWMRDAAKRDMRELTVSASEVEK